MNTKELQSTLKKLDKVVNKKSDIYALSQVKVTFNLHKVTLETSCMDMWMSLDVTEHNSPANEQSFLTDFVALKKIVEKVSSKEVTFNLIDGKLNLTAGKAVYTLKINPDVSEFPDVEHHFDQPICGITAEMWEDMLYVLQYTSTDEARPTMCSVYLETTEDTARFTCTDGFCIAFADSPAVCYPGKYLLPNAVKMVPGLAPELAALSYNPSMNIYTFSLPDGYISFLGIIGQYPYYREILPKKDKLVHHPEFILADFEESLNATKFVADEINGSSPVQIVLGEKSCYLWTRSLETGTVKVELDTAWAEDFRVNFNVNYLLKVCHQSCRTIQAHFTAHPITPQIFQTGNRTTVIMPIALESIPEEPDK